MVITLYKRSSNIFNEKNLLHKMSSSFEEKKYTEGKSALHIHYKNSTSSFMFWSKMLDYRVIITNIILNLGPSLTL
jgi:hypothetical protein